MLPSVSLSLISFARGKQSPQQVLRHRSLCDARMNMIFIRVNGGPERAMKCIRKRRKTYDKYRIVGATALDPQNKIKRIYSFECATAARGRRRGGESARKRRALGEGGGCNPSGNRPITSAPRAPCDFTIDIYERSYVVSKWKFTRPIMRIDNVALRPEVDRRPRVEPRSFAGYYNRICQSNVTIRD